MTRSDAEELAPLSVGVIEGGWSSSMRPWSDAVLRLTNRVCDVRPGVESALKVNVVFHVPGNILAPDFTGVRTGRYSKKNGALIVQVALPETAPDEVDADVYERFLAAVAEAEAWARKREIAEELTHSWAIARAAAPPGPASA